MEVIVRPNFYTTSGERIRSAATWSDDGGSLVMTVNPERGAGQVIVLLDGVEYRFEAAHRELGGGLELMTHSNDGRQALAFRPRSSNVALIQVMR